MNEKTEATDKEPNFLGVSPSENLREKVEQEAGWWECLFEGWEYVLKGKILKEPEVVAARLDKLLGLIQAFPSFSKRSWLLVTS